MQIFERRFKLDIVYEILVSASRGVEVDRLYDSSSVAERELRGNCDLLLRKDMLGIGKRVERSGRRTYYYLTARGREFYDDLLRFQNILGV